MGWNVKRLSKTLIIDPIGKISIVGQTDDTRIDFLL